MTSCLRQMSGLDRVFLTRCESSLSLCKPSLTRSRLCCLVLLFFCKLGMQSHHVRQDLGAK